MGENRREETDVKVAANILQKHQLGTWVIAGCCGWAWSVTRQVTQETWIFQSQQSHPAGLCAQCVPVEQTEPLCVSFWLKKVALAPCITQWGGGSVKCTCALKLSCFSLMLERRSVFSSKAHLDWELQHWKLCILPFEELQSSEVCPSGCSLPALQCWAPLLFPQNLCEVFGCFYSELPKRNQSLIISWFLGPFAPAQKWVAMQKRL